ncbi:hypothetical protein EXIGLDRAFT_727691, partial [Exidia glandulosa HHB12029]
MAITFAAVRKSVESILRQPLELTKVAEIKALLPDLVKFAYIPANDLQVQMAAQDRDGAPDIYASSSTHTLDDEEHVLVLEFLEGSLSTSLSTLRNQSQWSLTYAPSLTPEAMRKLVEKRNERFVQAVDELLGAVPEDEDPVALLMNAARDHVPVDPMAPQPDMGDNHQFILPSQTRRTVEEILDDLVEQDWYKNQIVARKIYEPKEATLGELTLSNTIWAAVKAARKISSLYSHQAAAIKAVQTGKNVIVSTPTASGKSIVYQVPVLEFLEENIESTALFVYPTKALAQDQKQAMEQLLFSCTGLENVKVATYDGDTPADQRRGIRDNASIVFANFDMVHTAILPHEDIWRRFLKNLKVVAVDELHYYTGLYGSHVAQVIRRLRRVCAAVGNRRIRFVSCSATISNPLGHMKNLFGIDDIEVITADGAPSGRKDFVIFNPPPKDGYHTHDKFMPYPAKHVSIRGIEEERYAVVDVTGLARGGQARILEEIEYSRAIFETYEGAVFLHQGQTFVVTEVSHDTRVARMTRADVNYTTSPRDFTNADAAQTSRIREVRGSPHRAFFGRVTLHTVVFGFFKLRNGQILESVSLETPPFDRETTGFWLDVPKNILGLMNEKNIHPAEAIHSASHALMNRFPMAQDLKTECKVAVKEYRPVETNRKRPARLIFYDGAGPGGGPASSAFDHISDLVHSAYEVVESCECKEGCIKCIHSPSCKESNEVSSKIGALLVLRGLLGLAIESDNVPDLSDEGRFPETIVVADVVDVVSNIEVESS